ncbi:MAG: hypothetical protein LUB63_06265, partial [Oscillospiraceae bacterium]|nr:hypothetical protein [Oscillospiraceae bacterium]
LYDCTGSEYVADIRGSASDVDLGEDVSLKLSVNGLTASAVSAEITYDSALVRYSGCEGVEGLSVTDNGGTLSVSISGGGDTLYDGMVLATLTFTTVGAGETSFEMTEYAVTPAEEGDWSDRTGEVSTATTVPLTINYQPHDITATSYVTSADTEDTLLEDAAFSLTDADGNAVSQDSAGGGAFVYTLTSGETYNYTASCEGYNMSEFDCTMPTDIDVTETSLSVALAGTRYDTQADASRYIYGSGNEGENSTISSGGTYYVAEGATGIITIETGESVTLVGRGLSTQAAYENLYIDYTVSQARLTIMDLYISNSENTTSVGNHNLIDFTGDDNYLYFDGVNCLDWDNSVSGYAAIHVNTETALTIGGVTEEDVLYLYKHEQGAGIGGNGYECSETGAEFNGDITITQGIFFIKGSKQGATIGAGSNAEGNASGEAGSITILGGEINGIQVSRGAFIGGSAGSQGASGGAIVYIYGGTTTINVDYSGAAIGGGGYAEGNDSEFGSLFYSGGSVKTVADYNAVVSDGTNLWADYGVTEMGVTDGVITSYCTNADNEVVYYAIIDVAEIPSSDGTYVVVDDNGDTLYSGGLHKYYYVNESLQKNDQVPITHTWDNWLPATDTNLYLFLTGCNHTLEINGETVYLLWDSEEESFTVADSLPETAMEISAVEESAGGDYTVSVDLADVADDAVLYAAAYNNGRLVAFGEEAIGAGQSAAQVTLSIDRAFDEIRVFLLGAEDFRPLCGSAAKTY